jgi:MFS family permease
MRAPAAVAAAPEPLTYTRDRRKRRAIIASIITGTTIEWYDFYLFGSLGTALGAHFYKASNPYTALLAGLATYATGFLIRPVGAAFFGRLGDLKGRKSAFLATLLLMGGATTAIGFLPGYASVGALAPALLVLMRLIQGFALGGEYGGAVIFVAENVPDGERGYYTSYVQVTATLGLFISIVVVAAVRNYLSPEDFANWGWRLPFIFSLFLLGIAGWVRARLGETPLWERLKVEKRLSTEPLVEAGRNWRKLTLVLFAATAGQGVVWYTAQFVSHLFLKSFLKVPVNKADAIVAVALACGMPFFIVFGALSDRIGRKNLMVVGNLLAAISFFPIYRAMQLVSNPLNEALMTLLVFVQVLMVTMVYGPIAAYLVEIFPARTRYTSLSIPYHLGNGIFGGLTAYIVANIALKANNIYLGLVFPCTVALITAALGALYLRETSKIRIWAEGRGKGSSSGTGPHAREPTGSHRPPSGVHLVPPGA